MFGQDQGNQAGQMMNDQSAAGGLPPAIQPHNGSYDGTGVDNSQSVVPVTVTPTAPAMSSAPVTATPSADDLADIKQKALHELMPVVDHLDQTPEEKFRTTMMIIQASDNRDLIKTAYEAAMQIADEKERALALVSVVNEINYFTQHDAKQSEQAN